MKNSIFITNDKGERKEVSQVKGLRIAFFGSNNSVDVHEGTDFSNCFFALGDNVHIKIGKTRHHIKKLGIGARRSNGGKVIIGKNFSCVACEINMNESSNIFISDDCMFSFGITLWNSDSHTMYDESTKEVLNPGADVIIGSHVWLGYHVQVMKGVEILPNTVVGALSVVTKSFMESGIAIAGIPAKIVKRGVNWSRKSPSNFARLQEESK